MNRGVLILAAGFFFAVGALGCTGKTDDDLYSGAFDMEIVVEPSERAAKEPIPPTAGMPPFPMASQEAPREKTETNLRIQKALKKAGFYNGPLDGLVGQKTKQAIRSFQESEGLVVDGKVGPKTWSKLKTYRQQ